MSDSVPCPCIHCGGKLVSRYKRRQHIQKYGESSSSLPNRPDSDAQLDDLTIQTPSGVLHCVDPGKGCSNLYSEDVPHSEPCSYYDHDEPCDDQMDPGEGPSDLGMDPGEGPSDLTEDVSHSESYDHNETEPDIEAVSLMHLSVVCPHIFSRSQPWLRETSPHIHHLGADVHGAVVGLGDMTRKCDPRGGANVVYQRG